MRELDRPLVVGTRQVQRTERFVGGAASAVQLTLGYVGQVLAGEQRPAEMLDGRGWRLKDLGPFGGLDCPLVRGRPRLGFEPVAGEILDRRLAAIALQVLQARGDASVQASPLAGEQLRANGFGDERVAEGELLGRFLDQQFGGDQLFQGIQQR